MTRPGSFARHPHAQRVQRQHRGHGGGRGVLVGDVLSAHLRHGRAVYLVTSCDCRGGRAGRCVRCYEETQDATHRFERPNPRFPRRDCQATSEERAGRRRVPHRLAGPVSQAQAAGSCRRAHLSSRIAGAGAGALILDRRHRGYAADLPAPPAESCASRSIRLPPSSSRLRSPAANGRSGPAS